MPASKNGGGSRKAAHRQKQQASRQRQNNGGNRHARSPDKRGKSDASNVDGALDDDNLDVGSFVEYSMALAHSVCFTPAYLWSDLGGEGVHRIYRAQQKRARSG